MSEAGTLLSDLENGRSSDGDLVQSILSDLNQPSGANHMVGMAAPPPAGARMPMAQAPSPPNVYPRSADPAVPTAHMIGRDHPTEADFQRMMMAAQGPMPFNAMVPQMQQMVPPMPQVQILEEPKKNSTGQVIDELKQPILVALIIFVVTLPAVNVLVAHYAPTLLRSGGDFTTTGMLVRALLGGALFWVFQRVIAPLVSL